MKENLLGTAERKLCREEGFSLLEVVLALSILSIAIFSIGALQTGAMKGNVTSRSISEASVKASAQLEALMALPWGHNDLNDRNGDGKAGLGNTGVLTSDWNITGPNLRYSIFWNIADNVVCVNTKSVTVIVQWVDRGTNRQVILQGVIPRVLITPS